MDYGTYLNVKATVKEIGIGLFRIIKFIIIKIIKLCLSIIYIISSIGYFIFGFMFLPGVYFGYTVAKEMLNGAGFFETLNWGMFLFCFGVPFVFGVIKTITKPKI